VFREASALVFSEYYVRPFHIRFFIQYFQFDFQLLKIGNIFLGVQQNVVKHDLCHQEQHKRNNLSAIKQGSRMRETAAFYNCNLHLRLF
jgi:hypothetical protein